MRDLARLIATNGIALYFTSLVVSGLQIVHSLESYIIVAVFFTVVSSLITPIFNVIMAPVNIITLGLFSSGITLITLFILTKFQVGITVIPFEFHGISIFGWEIQPFSASLLLSYLLVSVIIFLIVRLTNWLADV